MRGYFIDAVGSSIVRMSGPESLDLLQRISTNDLVPLKSGRSVRTILTNDKGRIVDVVAVLPHGTDGLLLVGSNPTPSALKDWIDKFIIMEDINVTEVTGQYFDIMVFGLEQNPQDFQLQTRVDFVREKWGSGVLVRLIGDAGSYDSVIRNLHEGGIEREPQGVFGKYRIESGIPAFPSELSTSYNPLEAGLDGLVSWTKGCYVGQEVIARLDTYKKVQRRLVRLRLDKIPQELPAPLLCRSIEVGLLTSASVKMDGAGFAGLAYLRTSYLQDRDELSIRQGREILHATVIDT